MKNINTRGILLGIALFGATSLIGFSTPASADTRNDHKVLKDRDQVGDKKQEIRDDVKQLNHSTSPGRRAQAKVELQKDQRDLGHDRGMLQVDKSRDGLNHNDRNRNNNDNRNNNSNNNGNRPDWSHTGGVHPGFPVHQTAPIHSGNSVRGNSGHGSTYSHLSRQGSVYNGRITNMRGGNSFNLRADGVTLYVVASGRLPRGLKANDSVRVIGRLNNNTLNNAKVIVTHER